MGHLLPLLIKGGVPAAPSAEFHRLKIFRLRVAPRRICVQGDMHLDMAKFGHHAGEADALAATASAPATTAASLTVDSSIPGADIDVDGAFVGSTPSTISVAPGEHTILVKKKGYAEWSRTMNVAGSAVRLNADLEANP